MSLTPDHFYTASASERDSASQKYAYSQEGTACIVFSPFQAQPPNTVPWHRLYLGGKQHNHFYTASASERDGASQKYGYTKEGTACFVYPPDKPQPPNTVALFRLYSNSQIDHFYTTSASERDAAVKKHGYTYEGISCYVFANTIVPSSGRLPLYRLYDPTLSKPKPIMTFTYCLTHLPSRSRPQTFSVMARTSEEALAIIKDSLPNKSFSGWFVDAGKCF